MWTSCIIYKETAFQHKANDMVVLALSEMTGVSMEYTQLSFHTLSDSKIPNNDRTSAGRHRMGEVS